MDIPMGIFARVSHLDSALPLRYDEFNEETLILDPESFRHAMRAWTTGVDTLFMAEAAEVKVHSTEDP